MARCAAIDEMFTIQPRRARAIASPKTWLGSSVPCRFRAITGSIPSTGRSKKERPGSRVAAGMLPPAALTSMSRRPHCSMTASRAPSICPRSSTSAGSASAVPSSASIDCATASACVRRRPSTPIFAPARASPCAIAPPSTPVPPVTTATWPSKLNRLARKSIVFPLNRMVTTDHRPSRQSHPRPAALVPPAWPERCGAFRGMRHIALLLLSAIRRGAESFRPELVQNMRRHLGCAGAGENTLHVQPAHAPRALHGGEVGEVPDLHTGHVLLACSHFKVAAHVVRLVLFGPHDSREPVHAGHRVGAELGHDDRLVPLLPDRVEFLLKGGQGLVHLTTQDVPAPVAVHTDNVAVLHPRGRAAHQRHEGDQTGGIELTRALQQRLQELLAPRHRGIFRRTTNRRQVQARGHRLVGHTP